VSIVRWLSLMLSKSFCIRDFLFSIEQSFFFIVVVENKKSNQRTIDTVKGNHATIRFGYMGEWVSAKIIQVIFAETLFPMQP